MIIHRYVQVGTALERALARVWPAAQSGTKEISDSIVQDLVHALKISKNIGSLLSLENLLLCLIILLVISPHPCIQLQSSGTGRLY